MTFGIIDEKDLGQSIGHLSSRIFVGYKKKTEKFREFLFIPKNGGAIRAFDPEMLRLIDECTRFAGKKENNQAISLISIEKWIEECTQDESVFNCIGDLLKNQEFREILYKNIQDNDAQFLESTGLTRDEDLYLGYRLVEVMLAAKSLLILSIILQPHEQRSRYPINGSNPISIYSYESPLVKALEQIIEIADTNVNRFRMFKKFLWPSDKVGRG